MWKIFSSSYYIFPKSQLNLYERLSAIVSYLSVSEYILQFYIYAPSK